jgi:hypothetical protein
MKVYLSSTQADLEPYRAAVMAAIRGLGHEHVAMEDYHAENAIPADKCREDVARCDIYVGIIAWRYGFVPADYDCSITELEYRTAVARPIPTLIFLLDEDAPWPPKFVDQGEPRKRVEAFRGELKQKKLVSFFNSPDDLRAKATQAIAKVVTQLLADESQAEQVVLSGERLAPIDGKPQILLSRLPVTGAARFGRNAQLKQMDEAWEQGRTNVLSIVAWGGVGKSALINTWLAHLANENYRGAEKAFAWSFYNQESDHQEASADVFIAEALTWFGDAHPTLGSLWEKGQRLAELVRKKRTLLVLDGLEVLQQPPGPDEGRLKDQAMQALLRELAAQNPGLCLIATRLPVTDLQPFIMPTPAFARTNLAFAAYIPAPPFAENGRAQFWVTPIAEELSDSQAETSLRQHHLGRILIASVHEAYPGHHVQFSHALKVRRPLRHIFSSTVFVEGWGLYSEELMLREGFKQDDPRFDLLHMSQIRDQLWRALRIVLDVGLHCKGMSQEEATDLLVRKHVLDRQSAASEVMYYCSAPTQPMSYMVGKLLIDALVEKCRASRDERFQSLAQIHNELLAHGSLPVPLLERALSVA